MEIRKTKYHALFDGMTWPRAGKALGDLEWVIRYSTPSKSELLVAASVISAYSNLISKNQKSRNEICQILKQVDLESE